jgi:hypothetical protein
LSDKSKADRHRSQVEQSFQTEIPIHGSPPSEHYRTANNRTGGARVHLSGLSQWRPQRDQRRTPYRGAPDLPDKE